MSSPKGKQKGIIAYFTFIGMFIALSMNQEPNKDIFAQWHIRNMFGLLLILFIAIAFDNTIGFYLYWLSVGLWGFSVINVLLGKQKGIPWLSEKFNEWFRFIG